MGLFWGLNEEIHQNALHMPMETSNTCQMLLFNYDWSHIWRREISVTCRKNWRKRGKVIMIYSGWAKNRGLNQICSSSKRKTLKPEWFYQDSKDTWDSSWHSLPTFFFHIAAPLSKKKMYIIYIICIIYVYYICCRHIFYRICMFICILYMKICISLIFAHIVLLFPYFQYLIAQES